MAASTLRTVQNSWVRWNPNRTFFLNTVTDSSVLSMYIPISRRGTFLPQIVPQSVANTVLNRAFLEGNEGNTIILNIHTKNSEGRWSSNTLVKAFNKRFCYDLTKCRISDTLTLTLGGGMILDEGNKPLLMCGIEANVFTRGVRVVLIDKSVYGDMINPQLATFIKNTLFKYYATTDADIRVTDIQDMTVAPFGLQLVSDISDVIRENADKIFYKI